MSDLSASCSGSSSADNKHIILSEAAYWLTLINDEPLNSQQQAALKRWQQRSMCHQQVWQAAQGLQQTLQALPKSQTPMIDRRSLLRCLTYLCVVGPASYAGYKYTPWRKLTADHTTAIGQQQRVYLADGSQLWLNTNTIVSIDFNQAQRTIYLHSGEIYIETSHKIKHSPFVINTPLGAVQALGTRFNVKHLANSEKATVSVQAHTVKVSTKNTTATQIIPSGKAAEFTNNTITLVEQNSGELPSWRKGELAANKLTLKDFLDELSRYRVGIIQCHDDAANLNVSGLFQLADTEQVLNLLEQTLPINIKYISRYWLRVASSTTN
jgi:transmembrane sensor